MAFSISVGSLNCAAVFFYSSRGRMLGLSCQALLVTFGKSGYASLI